tara:strand:+ start:74304 stop:74687 length:384 start_codon:yes stop_codon:yes gene_type:complete
MKDQSLAQSLGSEHTNWQVVLTKLKRFKLTGLEITKYANLAADWDTCLIGCLSKDKVSRQRYSNIPNDPDLYSLGTQFTNLWVKLDHYKWRTDVKSKKMVSKIVTDLIIVYNIATVTDTNLQIRASK